MPADESRRVTYLATGWKVVGPRAEAIAERAAAYGIPRIAAGSEADTLYAVQFTLPPSRDGRPTVERLLEHLTEEVRATWPDCPRLARDQEINRPPSRFSGARFDILADAGKQWMGEVVWRAVHPMVAGAPTTTRVFIEEVATYVRVTLHVTADEGRGSVRGYVGAGQAQPALLRQLRDDGLTPVWQGAALQPTMLRGTDIRELVQLTLPSPERRVPLVVLAPLEEGGYVVEPEDLAWHLLGRARLFVLQDHRLSFELTDTIGDRRMSCYKGAARAYLPGWSRHDDHYTHPLLVADRLGDPLMRATWLGEVGVWPGPREILPPSIEQRRAAARQEIQVVQEVRDVPARAGARALAVPGAGDDAVQRPVASAPAPQIDLRPMLEIILAEVRRLSGEVSRNADEIERLRTISAVRSSSTNAIERRLARLEDILEQAMPGGEEEADAPATRGAAPSEPDEEQDDRSSLVAVVQEASETYADELVFLDAAVASAAASPYEDPERVRAILDAMARVARKRRDGQLGTSLREAFGECGIEYRSAISRHTPARLREQYRFMHGSAAIEAEEHIVLGKVYDPRRCLRIYFSSRVAGEARFVIAHVGRHFEVMTSN